MSLNEQIAVLDGLAALDPNDGRIGQTGARVDQYGRRVGPGVLRRMNVIDPSGGANLTGGSNWVERMPLTPSNAGLAGMQLTPRAFQMSAAELQQLVAAAGGAIATDGVWGSGSTEALRKLVEKTEGERASTADILKAVKPYAKGRAVLVSADVVQGLAQYVGGKELVGRAFAGFGSLPGMLPPRIGVIDPSGGANFTGGSNWAPRMPLTPSNAGLADMSYGRAGLGNGEYGRAGLGRFAGALADADLITAAETVARQQALDPSDGRIGQYRAQPTQYADRVAAGVLRRRDVLDPSEGANYSGGSNWTARMPLTPSNAGLAGLDAVPDSKLGIAGPLKKQIGKNVVENIKKKLLGIERIWNSASPEQKNQLFAQYRAGVQALLQHLGGVRVMRMKALAVKRAGGVPGARAA